MVPRKGLLLKIISLKIVVKEEGGFPQKMSYGSEHVNGIIPKPIEKIFKEKMHISKFRYESRAWTYEKLGFFSQFQGLIKLLSHNFFRADEGLKNSAEWALSDEH